MVKASGAKSTDFIQPEDVNDLKLKCGDTALKWAQTAECIWNENHPCHKCLTYTRDRDK